MDDLISRLSEIRSEYNCFDENEEPYYRALSEAIKILSRREDRDNISRQAAIDAISHHGEIENDYTDLYHDGYCDGVYDAVDVLKDLPSAQQCMTATSNTMMSDTVKIPVMDGTIERLPTADVMDDLIKRQDAITAYCEHECGIKGMTRENCGATDCGTIFDDIPSAQPEVLAHGEGELSAQPEIIRCKDCKYMTEHYDVDGNAPYWTCSEWDSGTDYDGFCSYGERR